MESYNNNAKCFYFTGQRSYNNAYRYDSFNNHEFDKTSLGNTDSFDYLGAEFIECRSWDNSDDNFDCIDNYGNNLYDSCWAFKINYLV